MKDKPNNILMEGLIIKDRYDINKELKESIVLSWNKIHRKGREDLGRKNCVAFERYIAKLMVHQQLLIST